MKKGLTDNSSIIVIGMATMLVLLLAPAVIAARKSAISNQIKESNANHGVFRCIKSFETNRNQYFSVLKVSLKSVDSSRAEVFICQTDDIFAQFEDNKYYEVSWFETSGRKYIAEVKETKDFHAEKQ